MTHEEKINYMRIAAGICRFGLSYEHTDLLLSLYELIIEKGGDADLRSISKVEADAKNRADIKSRSELLDKVSEKVGETSTD